MAGLTWTSTPSLQSGKKKKHGGSFAAPRYSWMSVGITQPSLLVFKRNKLFKYILSHLIY